MTKKRRRVGKTVDSFVKDKRVAGEYENPGPKIDGDAHFFSSVLSKIMSREKTGFVVNWLPPWGKKEKIEPFSFFFFEDGLALDSFNRVGGEMDALADDFSPSQKEQILKKTAICSEKGIAYMVLGPDDEPDETQIASKIGRTTYKKPTGGSGMVPSGVGAGQPQDDGISEQGD